MKKYILSLFLLTSIFFNSTATSNVQSDTIPAMLLPFTILSGRGIYFDDYVHRFPQLFPDTAYYFQKSGSHFVSSYPMVAGVAAVPIYLPIYLYIISTQTDPLAATVSNSFFSQKIAAAFIASISVVCFFLLMRKLTKNNKMSFIFSLIFGFCTQTFSISSQQLWQHGVANLWMILSQYFLFRKSKILSFTTLVLTFFSRLVFFVYGALLIILLCIYDAKNRVQYISGFLVGVVLFCLLSFFLYGGLLSNQYHSTSSFNFFWIGSHLLGILFSPGRGLLFYQPFFLVSLFAIVFTKQLKKLPISERIIFFLNYFYLIALICVVSVWEGWWGGNSWGSRLLTDGAVSAVILLYFMLRFLQNKYFTIFVGVLISWSFLMQIIGVYFYPKGSWDEYPKNVDSQESRLWDFWDNPISRNLVVGPNYRLLDLYSYKVGKTEKVTYSPEQYCSIKKIGQGKSFGYHTLSVLVRNNSGNDWITNGPSSIDVRQMYFKNGELLSTSPIPGSPLPTIFKNGSQVRVDLVLVTPSDPVDMVVITLIQNEVSRWLENCKLEVRLH